MTTVGSGAYPAQALKEVNLVSHDGQISKKDLRLIKQRFVNLHKLKMQRAKDAITPRQQIFLDILPLLFHVNHPILPGYVSAKTPAGIADYTPGKSVIQCAKKLGKGFVYQKRAKRLFAIESLFIMGSVGSIAYAKGSDMDMWLCYSSSLSTHELTLLSEKATAIEQWAETLGLEAHFFLMDAEKFKNGVATPLSAESSGTTQHHLLLEEFYRTALYVAGRYPVWWLVPPEYENDYQTFVENLLERRFVDRSDVIDFGGLEKVPAEEFLGASFWHLYKAIDSPYKSLLKLLLMESYVAHYPHSTWAAVRMKQSVYKGETDVNKVDPYLILYETLEEYLMERDELNRLGLMRYCFYNKLVEAPRAGALRAKGDWRHDILSEMVKNWQPLPDYLETAINQTAWSIKQTQQEKERLTKELTYSYRLLMRFANERVDKKNRDSKDLTLLGRKLSAAFIQKPGKLERPTVKNRRLLHEGNVFIRQNDKQAEHPSWTLSHSNEYGGEEIIRQAHGLIELVAWCVDYSILSNKTNIALAPGVSQITPRELMQTVRQVKSFFSKLPNKVAHLGDYEYQAYVSNVVLIINSGLDPMSRYTDQGVNLMSERSNALSFGSKRQNLVHSVDMLSRNSWNEISVAKYRGAEGLIACLCDAFASKALGKNQQAPVLMCASFSSPRAMSIAKRVNTLFDDVAKIFKKYSLKTSPRAIVQASRSHYIMQANNRKMTARVVDGDTSLMFALSEAQPVYSPVYFDSFMQSGMLLPAIFSVQRAHVVQVFYNLSGDMATVYILDEKGSLFVNEQKFISEEWLLQPYQGFLEASLQARQLAFFEQELKPIDIEYYQLEKQQQSWELKEVVLATELFTQGMQLRVAFDKQVMQVQLYCDEETFSVLDYGDEIYSAAADYISKKRKSGNYYSVYVSNVDVPIEELGVATAKEVQIIHYLQYKQMIEDKINSLH